MNEHQVAMQRLAADYEHKLQQVIEEKAELSHEFGIQSDELKELKAKYELLRRFTRKMLKASVYD